MVGPLLLEGWSIGDDGVGGSCILHRVAITASDTTIGSTIAIISFSERAGISGASSTTRSAGANFSSTTSACISVGAASIVAARSCVTANAIGSSDGTANISSAARTCTVGTFTFTCTVTHDTGCNGQRDYLRRLWCAAD